jgi:RNA recognition motif-containing protein
MQETAQRDGRRRRPRNNRNRRDGEGRPERRSDRPSTAPSGFAKFLSIITFGLIGGGKKKSSGGKPNRPVTNVTYVNGASDKPRSERPERAERRDREARPAPTPREVTSERLHVGNLSFDASESDLFELFNGVGSVRNAEIVVNKHNQRSKGFGFITMSSIEEAKRAVAELHNKEFMGRALNVGGAKPPREDRPADEEESS